MDEDRALAMAMGEALAEARTAAAAGDLPYGAVIVDPDGSVVARSRDRVVADQDLTSHAEFNAVRAAISIRDSDDLRDHGLVSTCEPCAMCFSAAWTAGISLVVFGASMADVKALQPEAMDEIVIDARSLNLLAQRRVRIIEGVRAAECRALWGS